VLIVVDAGGLEVVFFCHTAYSVVFEVMVVLNAAPGWYVADVAVEEVDQPRKL